METGGVWGSTGSPTTNELSTTHKKSGVYSRHLITDAAYEGLKQDIGSDTGVFKVSFWIYAVSGTQYRFFFGDSETVDNTISLNVWTEIECVVGRSAGTDIIYLQSLDSSAEFYVDDFSVKQQASAMNPTYIELTGNGGWQHERFVFRTDSIATSAILRLLPGIANVGEVYFDYAFCIESMVDKGGFEGLYTSDVPDGWTLANSPAGAEELTEVKSGYKTWRINNGYAYNDTIPSLTSGRDYLLGISAKYISGTKTNLAMGIDKSGGGDAVPVAIEDVDTTWRNFNGIVTPSNSASYYLYPRTSPVSTADVYHDDFFMILLDADFQKADRVLKYDSALVPVTGFTIDFFVRHSWDADDSLTHGILQTTGGSSTRNTFRLFKSSNNSIYFEMYGDTTGGYKEIILAVTESNFAKEVWHRMTLTFDPALDTMLLYLNGVSIGTPGSGGTWVDPTTWGAYLFVGGKNDNTPGDVEICQLSIWDTVKEAVTIQTWNDTDRNFFDDRVIRGVPGIANESDDHLTSEVSGIEPMENTNLSPT